MLVIKDNTSGTVYPAEFCTWIESSVAGGYTVISVTTYITGAAVAIADAELGYIGKSGRFVKLSK